MTLAHAQRVAKRLQKKGIQVTIEEYREACRWSNQKHKTRGGCDYAVIEQGVLSDQRRIWAAVSSMESTTEAKIKEAIRLRHDQMKEFWQCN